MGKPRYQGRRASFNPSHASTNPGKWNRGRAGAGFAGGGRLISALSTQIGRPAPEATTCGTAPPSGASICIDSGSAGEWKGRTAWPLLRALCPPPWAERDSWPALLFIREAGLEGPRRPSQLEPRLSPCLVKQTQYDRSWLALGFRSDQRYPFCLQLPPPTVGFLKVTTSFLNCMLVTNAAYAEMVLRLLYN